ncbi:L-threonylcarbamoyladenylate synthase [Leucobacter sp. M11]|uniref:L-threonylcarbamoyladenylate synthase n=1 Tax=Leucobacter sp. M11 TaxID=2993565 RepID=UPI002D7F5262|nr:L-threonylcarbamoyladenylate synthase [Leucobacter sp. M11]MEB4615632.1 L-threonylcarbamoyladenylate synthase [Leucobacter sp. M11]
MAHVYDCSDTAQLLTGTREARTALGRGELAVVPTDTVYGVAADAFNPAAVARLLAAKGRGRQSPPPVLVPNLQTLSALAAAVPGPVLALVERFWPGPLTVILPAQPSLSWDLGDTGGTVALRMPAHDLTLELLRETGPLAVSSANLTGQPAATNAGDAQGMLGDAVSVYLDAGESSADGASSTIIDARSVTEAGGTIRVLRPGGVSAEQIRSLLPQITVEEGPWPKP